MKILSLGTLLLCVLSTSQSASFKQARDGADVDSLEAREADPRGPFHWDEPRSSSTHKSSSSTSRTRSTSSITSTKTSSTTTKQTSTTSPKKSSTTSSTKKSSTTTIKKTSSTSTKKSVSTTTTKPKSTSTTTTKKTSPTSTKETSSTTTTKPKSSTATTKPKSSISTPKSTSTKSTSTSTPKKSTSTPTQSTTSSTLKTSTIKSTSTTTKKTSSTTSIPKSSSKSDTLSATSCEPFQTSTPFPSSDFNNFNVYLESVDPKKCLGKTLYLGSDAKAVTSCQSASSLNLLADRGQLLQKQGSNYNLFSSSIGTNNIPLAASSSISANYFYWIYDGAQKLQWTNSEFQGGAATFCASPTNMTVYAFLNGVPPPDCVRMNLRMVSPSSCKW